LKGNYNAFIKKETSSEISEINLKYLKKIVSLCNQSKVKLVFFRTPIHQKLFESYDEKTFQSIRTKQFNSIAFLDFHDFKLENDEYGDFNHLNFKGAKKFSEHFNTIVQQGVSKPKTPLQK
jgi:GGDEF domain-containing protein